MSDVAVSMTAAPTLHGGVVVLGSRVRVRDSEGDHEHTIVARVRVDTPLGCVSVASPVGKALLGRRSDEHVQVHTPGGIRLLTITDVAAL